MLKQDDEELTFDETHPFNDVDDGDDDEMSGSKLNEPKQRRNASFLGFMGQHLKLGIIGKTNVGKSSLFNLLGKTRLAHVENSLFTTINPNFATFEMYDPRISAIAELFGIIGNKKYATLIDTAGIVRGSRNGAGVGIKSLEHIRTANILLHVVRGYFDNGMTIHYDETVDPVRDMWQVHQELMLEDLAIIERQILLLEDEIDEKKNATGRKVVHEHDTLQRAYALLVGSGRPHSVRKKKKKYSAPIPKVCNGCFLSLGDWDSNEVSVLNQYQFHTAKEMIILVNLAPREFLRKSKENSAIIAVKQAVAGTIKVFPISVAFEEVLYELKQEDTCCSSGDGDVDGSALTEYSVANPTHVSVLPLLMEECFRSLDLMTFFTHGTSEVSSWWIRRGTSVGQVGVCIHVDIVRTFLSADVTPYEDFIDGEGDYSILMKEGRCVTRSKHFFVNDGDVVRFKTRACFQFNFM